MGREVAVLIAGFPDHALQRFQRRVLTVLVDPALQYFSNAGIRPGGADFGPYRIDPARDFRVLAARLQKCRQRAPRVREQHVLDE